MFGSKAAKAACVCLCLSGQVQPVCDSKLDLEPLCPPRLCPLEPPALKPLASPRLPPLGTTSCRQEHVMIGGRWQWIEICE